jgi:hypothetical protein
VYTEATLDATTVTEITDGDAWWDVVITHFGLDYHDVPADARQTLWSRTSEAHHVWRAEKDG